MSITIDRVMAATPDLAGFLLAHHADMAGTAPFGAYAADPHSTFMSIELDTVGPPAPRTR
ncbi:hypothetical protein [Microbacterium sp. NPDC087589]|uniref:hypothetical protein n=1 Tax=Microbacterium sp. NPDC087589 TaxID=3364191 RepID=UPI0037F6BE32